MVALVASVDAAVLAAMGTMGPIGGFLGILAGSALVYCFVSPIGLILGTILVSHIAELPGIETSVFYPTKWAITSALLIVVLSRWLMQPKRMDWRLSTAQKWLIRYAMWLTICALFAVRPLDTVIESIRLVSLLAACLIARELINTERDVKYVLIAVNLAVLSSAIYSFAAFAESGYFRFSGFLLKPNPYGIFLGFTVPLLFAALYVCRGLIWRFFFSVGLTVGVVAVLLSWSRAAWLNLLVQVVALAIVQRSKRLILAIAVVLLAAITFAVTSPEIYQLASTVGRLASGTAHRTIRWEKGLEAIGRSPIVGYGFQYRNEDVLDKVSLADYSEAVAFKEREGSFDPHNLYIHTMLNAGVPGLVMLGMLCYHLFLQLARGRSAARSSMQRLLYSVVIAMLAGGLCNGFFERNVLTGMGAVNNYFWITLGMVEAIKRKNLLAEETASVPRIT